MSMCIFPLNCLGSDPRVVLKFPFFLSLDNLIVVKVIPIHLKLKKKIYVYSSATDAQK